MLIVPTTYKSVSYTSIRSFMIMSLGYIVTAMQYSVSTLIKIVIVFSRFLERPQKRSRGNQLIHRRLSKQNR